MTEKNNENQIKKQLKWGALFLAGASLLSRAMGVLRDALIATHFGTGSGSGLLALDAYYVAFKIPDLLYSLLIAGTFSAVFIPLYLEIQGERGEKIAILWAKKIFQWMVLILTALVALAELLAPFLVPFLAAGLSAEEQALATTLTQIMLLSPLLLGVSALAQGLENAHKHFLGMALAPLFYNASLIVAVLIFAPQNGVFALAWGVVVGAFLHAMIQIPGVFKTPFFKKFEGEKEDQSTLPKQKEFWRLLVPRTIGASGGQIATLLDTFFATLISKGALSTFTFAFNLQSLPYGVVAVSLSTAWFAELSEKAKDKEAFLKTFRHVLETILYWSLPAVVGLFILRSPIITLLLENGQFTASSTRDLAALLAILVWVAIPESLIPLLSRSLYALKETRRPVEITFASIVLAAMLLGIQMIRGEVSILTLGWAVLLRSTLNATGLVWVLKNKLKLAWKDLSPSAPVVKKIGGGLVAMILVLICTFKILPQDFSTVTTVFSLIAGAGVYLLSTRSQSLPKSRGVAE